MKHATTTRAAAVQAGLVALPDAALSALIAAWLDAAMEQLGDADMADQFAFALGSRVISDTSGICYANWEDLTAAEGDVDGSTDPPTATELRAILAAMPVPQFYHQVISLAGCAMSGSPLAQGWGSPPSVVSDGYRFMEHLAAYLAAYRSEEIFDILDAHEATGTAGGRCIHVSYDVSFTDFDEGDPRLPSDILTNWPAYQFVKVFRGGRYVRCGIRPRIPAQRSRLLLCEIRFAWPVPEFAQHTVIGCRDDVAAAAFRREALAVSRQTRVPVSVWLVRGTFRDRGGKVVQHTRFVPLGRRRQKGNVPC